MNLQRTALLAVIGMGSFDGADGQNWLICRREISVVRERLKVSLRALVIVCLDPELDHLGHIGRILAPVCEQLVVAFDLEHRRLLRLPQH